MFPCNKDSPQNGSVEIVAKDISIRLKKPGRIIFNFLGKNNRCCEDCAPCYPYDECKNYVTPCAVGAHDDGKITEEETEDKESTTSSSESSNSSESSTSSSSKSSTSTSSGSSTSSSSRSSTSSKSSDSTCEDDKYVETEGEDEDEDVVLCDANQLDTVDQEQTDDVEEECEEAEEQTEENEEECEEVEEQPEENDEECQEAEEQTEENDEECQEAEEQTDNVEEECEENEETDENEEECKDNVEECDENEEECEEDVEVCEEDVEVCEEDVEVCEEDVEVCEEDEVTCENGGEIVIENDETYKDEYIEDGLKVDDEFKEVTDFEETTFIPAPCPSRCNFGATRIGWGHGYIIRESQVPSEFRLWNKMNTSKYLFGTYNPHGCNPLFLKGECEVPRYSCHTSTCHFLKMQSAPVPAHGLSDDHDGMLFELEPSQCGYLIRNVKFDKYVGSNDSHLILCDRPYAKSWRVDHF